MTGAILVFGESDNDRLAMVELVRALVPTTRVVRAMRQPIILMKGTNRPETRRTTVSKVAAVHKAECVRGRVDLVVAHEDADAIEPAHEPHAQAIERALATHGIDAISAVPAFEIDAWWYLWPDAVRRVCSGWKRLKRDGKSVGFIKNAKEQLTADLGTAGKRKYRESDSIGIARAVREQGLANKPVALSNSYDRFRVRLRAALGPSIQQGA